MNYNEIELKELAEILHDGIVLIVTATDTETEAMHSKLTPLLGYSDILLVYSGSYTYYFGVFGKYKVAHVQSNMGSIGRDSAIMAVSNAVRTLNPKFVIMIGIAFGIDSEKQNIGDVLISEGVIPYDNKRVGQDVIYRGQNAPSSKILLSRFKSIRTWQYLLDESKVANKIVAQILSGEELIDSKERRDELVSEFPISKGGEMEGAGLFAACDGTVDWILVKGICDFADGNKGVNKKQNQNIAINSALSLCLELFNSKYAFNEFGLTAIDCKMENNCDYKNVDNVLFEVYNKFSEQYYLFRELDNTFNSICKQYSVWIHGVSGCGKTNLILRNLIIYNINYIPISLASCIDLSARELFAEILFDLEAKFGKVVNSLSNDSFPNICRNIINLLRKHCVENECVIFIEEIPISSDLEYDQFVFHFSSFLIYKQMEQCLNKIRFVLSSIKNPTSHIRQNQQKIHQQVKFVELTNWSINDTDNLIQLINKELSIRIDEPILEKLRTISGGSPRFVKKFYRNLLTCSLLTSVNYENILLETEHELKLYCHE